MRSRRCRGSNTAVCALDGGADIGRVPAPLDDEEGTLASPAPRAGLILMALVIVVMAALSIYSNVQRARRDQIETVTIVPAAPVPSPSPIASP